MGSANERHRDKRIPWYCSKRMAELLTTVPGLHGARPVSFSGLAQWRHSDKLPGSSCSTAPPTYFEQKMFGHEWQKRCRN